MDLGVILRGERHTFTCEQMAQAYRCSISESVSVS